MIDDGNCFIDYRDKKGNKQGIHLDWEAGMVLELDDYMVEFITEIYGDKSYAILEEDFI